MKLNDYRLFRSYQEEAQKYAAYSTPDYPFFGLSEETGEILGKLAKASRKTGTCSPFLINNIKQSNFYFEDLKEDLVKELGDLLWQLSACCNELGVNLDEVARENLKKLEDRASRGKIVGEGDNR